MRRTVSLKTQKRSCQRYCDRTERDPRSIHAEMWMMAVVRAAITMESHEVGEKI